MTSLGAFVTGATYPGRNGYSMREENQSVRTNVTFIATR